MKKQLLFLATAICSLNLMAQTVPFYVTTNGLLGWWPFNGNANDVSGNSNNGTVNGATLTSDRNGNANAAYYFSSTGCATRIDAQINTTSIQTGLTIAIWISKTGEGCISPRILEFRVANDGPGEAQWGWPFPNASNKIYMGSTTSTGFKCSYGVPIVPNNFWTHLVYTNDGINGRFYQDGILKGTVASAGNPILSGNVAFGRMNHPSNDAFNGRIDDIGIWNRALTQREILSLYSGCSSSAITIQPINQNLVDGNNAQFSVSTSATSSSYQWQQNTSTTGFANLSNFGQYSGVTSNILTINSVTQLQNNYGYRCIINNGGCTDTSSVAILTVTANGIDEYNNEGSIGKVGG